jgi:tripartite-type tricarboxylate transporter receptor subunit TctC
MKHLGKILFVSLLTAVLGLGWFGPTWAEYPERPITMYCPYSGGTADSSLRAITNNAQKILGQPIIVLNKPGASGSLAASMLATARPDGYTLGMVTFGPLTMAPHMYDITYDPFNSFDFIFAFGKYMYGPCVRSDSPIQTLKDLVKYAKANPGKVKYSTVGLATPTHFGMSKLAKMEGLKWDVVVFKEVPAAVSACLGGHVDVVSQTPAAVVPAIKGGQLRLLASMSDTRWKWVPDVPTVRELGYDFDVVSWLALAAPKGTPKAIMDKLIPAFKKALDDPEVITLMDRIYVPIVYRSAADYMKLVEVEYKDVEKMIRDLGLHKSQKK